MSIYKTVQVDMDDIDIIRAVLDELGLPYIYNVEGNLAYHKWKDPAHTRGTDATIVIGRLNGGLDRTSRKYCGDTAFVVAEDGTVQVKLDIAHGNAPLNWAKVQNLYAYRALERNLPRGYTLAAYEMDPITGAIEIRLKDTRRTSRTQKAKRRQRVKL